MTTRDRWIVNNDRVFRGAPDRDQVFDEFVQLKRACGEPTETMTYEKFVVKLRDNRQTLISKYGCRSVKFQVYVKDGKAALKATPVR